MAARNPGMAWRTAIVGTSFRWTAELLLIIIFFPLAETFLPSLPLNPAVCTSCQSRSSVFLPAVFRVGGVIKPLTVQRAVGEFENIGRVETSLWMGLRAADGCKGDLGAVEATTGGDQRLSHFIRRTFDVPLQEAEDLCHLGAVWVRKNRYGRMLPWSRRVEDGHVKQGSIVKVYLRPRRFPIGDVDWSARVLVDDAEFLVGVKYLKEFSPVRCCIPPLGLAA